ncbi:MULTISPECIES: ABC transporter permease [unclassified Neisseria]|uniref:ABC transporter permease n=1 Tax=unclassified Neisseria TaxID=2623750 RepID=UPI002666C8E1|nr:MULTISPECIES: ABC transporter permease [unclassified Neisseria]MDO1508877.1 ABC transporter permease [Neisseria sp. MVDL19-042950]MDO1515136.1 ABC transporter permease [Neisseria sp. MVDL18-041461]MDO1562496.1 ABC transporter permease [Neisseria sp. MVDL20-010259]
MLIASIVKEIKLLSRDLHGVAVLFVMPVLFMLIMSAALSNEDELNHRSNIVFIGEKDSKLNQDFVKALQAENLAVQQAAPSELADFQTALQQGRFELLVVNPNGSKTALTDEKPLQLWLNPSVDRSWLLGMKGVLQKHYTEERLAHFLDGNHVTLENNKRAPIKKIQNKVNEDLDKKFAEINDYLDKDLWEEVYLNRQGTQVTKPNSVQHSVPAWLIFGMFFIMIPLSNVMAMERQTNTITRLRMARASAWKLIVSKLVPYFVINQLQFAGMVALGYFVLPHLNMPAFELSGGLLSYAALSSAVSLAALGYGLLVSVIARTTEHAVVLGGGGIIIMAALGGIMVPVYVMPEVMQTVSQFSPMGWALTAFQNLLLNHYSLMQIHTQLLLLAGFGVAALTVAALLYRHQLRTQVRF